MPIINQIIPKYNVAGGFCLNVVVFEIYKIINNPEWDSLIVLIVSGVALILHLAFAQLLDSFFKATVGEVTKKYFLRRAWANYVGLLYLITVTLLLFYCGFYKGLYGLFMIFGDFSIMGILFRLAIIVLSFYTMGVLKAFVPHKIVAYVAAGGVN